VANGHRANEVVHSVRDIVAKTDRAEVPLDIRELIRETIALVRDDLEAAGIVVQLELAAQLLLLPMPQRPCPRSRTEGAC
jgi:hypothetical protein